jgi:phosphoserine phosphatase RsbU/P
MIVLKNRGIAFKLILFFTVSSGLIFLFVFTFNYRFSRSTIEKNVESNAQNLVLATVNRIETVLLPIQKIPENLALFLEKGSFSKEELLQLLRVMVENNVEIYGAAIAFEPHGFDQKSIYFAPYFYKNKGKIAFSDLSSESYQYLNWDWYQIPKELNRPDWSEPYFDEGGGNILMATYSVPFYRTVGGKRQFMGIVTADISLGWLQEVVSSIKVLQTGYGFLISKNGTLLTHPLKELVMNETLFGVAEARKDHRLREIGKKMVRGETGFVPFTSMATESRCWMYYTPIPSNGWSLAVLFPQDEFTADVTRLNHFVITLGIVGLFLLSIAVAFIARSFTRPLKAMARATEKIATGNLDIELPPVTSGDEVGKLSEAFRYMKESLKEYIQQLTETTASKERIESELKIAHDIQMSILPKIFPPFPDRKEFDIYAVIEPAREVGGDFYDFFFVDDEHLCFVIGDVSGKGVPASLFMAVTKTLIKGKAVWDADPGRVLTKVNTDLNQGNEACMFVTIFIGILNTKTGEVLYANGGHNPPLILRRRQTRAPNTREEASLSTNLESTSGVSPGKVEGSIIRNGNHLPLSEEGHGRFSGDVEFLVVPKGLVVGVMEDSTYQTDRVTFEPGDSIFIYTDGVTEAMNERGELFSEERLKKQLIELRGKSVQEVIVGTMEGIVSFSHGVSQSDDITMMMIQFRGEEG